VPTVRIPGRPGSDSCPVSGLGVAAAVIASACALALAPAQADAATCRVASVVPTSEAQMFRLINAERRAAGVKPVRFAPRLRSVGRHTSRSIARGAPFRHGPLSWGRGRHVGQNLGWTGNAPVAMEMMMASPGHRANVLRPAWRGMGVGAAHDCRGRIVFTVNFSAAPRG
jgi:uncharacterized protein YkwD